VSRSVAFGVHGPGWVGNRLSEWLPGASATAGTAFGWTFAFTGSSTTTGIAASPDLKSQIPRMTFATTEAQNATAGIVSSSPVCWRGNAPRFGGFHFGVRFALGAAIDGSRAFIGLGAAPASIVDAEPSASADIVADACDRTLGIADRTSTGNTYSCASCPAPRRESGASPSTRTSVRTPPSASRRAAPRTARARATPSTTSRSALARDGAWSMIPPSAPPPDDRRSGVLRVGATVRLDAQPSSSAPPPPSSRPPARTSFAAPSMMHTIVIAAAILLTTIAIVGTAFHVRAVLGRPPATTCAGQR
jgi:hypothetical protein